MILFACNKSNGMYCNSEILLFAGKKMNGRYCNEILSYACNNDEILLFAVINRKKGIVNALRGNKRVHMLQFNPCTTLLYATESARGKLKHQMGHSSCFQIQLQR